MEEEKNLRNLHSLRCTSIVGGMKVISLSMSSSQTGIFSNPAMEVLKHQYCLAFSMFNGVTPLKPVRPCI